MMVGVTQLESNMDCVRDIRLEDVDGCPVCLDPHLKFLRRPPTGPAKLCGWLRFGFKRACGPKIITQPTGPANKYEGHPSE